MVRKAERSYSALSLKLGKMLKALLKSNSSSLDMPECRNVIQLRTTYSNRYRKKYIYVYMYTRIHNVYIYTRGAMKTKAFRPVVFTANHACGQLKPIYT